MRVFLPSTLPALAEALRAGQVGRIGEAGSGPVTGFAVTPALREAYAAGDEEELEYAALTEAARASLRLLAADEGAPPRRVVLAADIPADQIKSDVTDKEPARVVIADAVPLARVACAHVDDPAAVQDVGSAVRALAAADAGDEDARFDVDGAEGHELGWYATQELGYLALSPFRRVVRRYRYPQDTGSVTWTRSPGPLRRPTSRSGSTSRAATSGPCWRARSRNSPASGPSSR